VGELRGWLAAVAVALASAPVALVLVPVAAECVAAVEVDAGPTSP
jgi:hypothetical protein